MSLSRSHPTSDDSSLLKEKKIAIRQNVVYLPLLPVRQGVCVRKKPKTEGGMNDEFGLAYAINQWRVTYCSAERPSLETDNKTFWGLDE